MSYNRAVICFLAAENRRQFTPHIISDNKSGQIFIDEDRETDPTDDLTKIVNAKI